MMKVNAPMLDFFVSATVRSTYPMVTGRGWWLWTARIQASSLSAARAHAISMIVAWDREYGELQILWDASPIHVASECETARTA